MISLTGLTNEKAATTSATNPNRDNAMAASCRCRRVRVKMSLSGVNWIRV
jgi:hypothetical protein